MLVKKQNMATNGYGYRCKLRDINSLNITEWNCQGYLSNICR